VSNPKAIVVYGGIFSALLPAQLSAGAAVVLLALVCVIETAWYAVVAVVLSAPAPRRWYLRGKPTLDRLAGAVLGLLGVKLVVATS
jgi:threonine/homoserine/homoserine lactone efflux protein